MAIVVDASALVKLAKQEEGSTWMEEYWQQQAGEAKKGPALLYFELGRAIQKMGGPPEAHAALLIDVDLVHPAADVSPEWAVLAGLTFYDAAYLALAKEVGRLVTADKALAGRAEALGIHVDRCPG